MKEPFQSQLPKPTLSVPMPPVKPPRETHPSSDQKSFKVVAVIKYHVDVGIFRASSKEDAYRIATESTEYWQIATHSRGGIYDLEIKEIP